MKTTYISQIEEHIENADFDVSFDKDEDFAKAVKYRFLNMFSSKP